uniref:Uncharacterized protein n=1 Tax=Steinernema glaseri TaxID=37863 RepID=A0A1I7XWJ5_9BILA
MESVPLEFIERTIMNVGPYGTDLNNYFRSLQSHWGAYANLQYDKSHNYFLNLFLKSPSEVYCQLKKGCKRSTAKTVLVEETPSHRNFNLFIVNVKHRPARRIPYIPQDPNPPGELLDEQKVRMLQRFIRRSSGFTWLRTVKATPRTNATLLDEKREDLAQLPQTWVGQVPMPDEPIAPPGLEILLKSKTYKKHTCTAFVAVMAVSPPLMDELKRAMVDVSDEWPGRPELLHVEYTPTHLTFACWSPV